MKVGIIAPIRFLEEYCNTDVMYCLPGLVAESEVYRRFYQNRSQGQTLVMDCRKPGWRRMPEGFEVVKQAMRHVRPDVVVFPSYMFNAAGTVELARRFNKEVRQFYPATYVLCPEGTTKKEVCRCADKLQDKMDIDRFAVPSHQYKLVDMGEAHSDATVIFIDNHERIEELAEQVKSDAILVTSLPVRLGLRGRLLSDCLPTPPSLTFYEKKDPYPMITKQNVEETIEFYEGGK